MLYKMVNILCKLKLKFNKLRFLSNTNVKVGNNFKLANYTTYIIHPTSKVIVGDQVDIRNFFNLTIGKGAELTIGNKVFFNNNCSINCLDYIEIGENTLFGENVKMYDHNHQYDENQVFHKEFTKSSIKIGTNCWLGSNSVILKGVTIGDNVIIGAGCIIHKDVPANSVIVNRQDHYTIKN